MRMSLLYTHFALRGITNTQPLKKVQFVTALGIISSMITTLTTVPTSTPGRIRPLNILRDLPSVADLVELCFSSTLDPEGRSYIDQMRRNGRDSSFLNWAPRVIETVSLPLSGFVWEDNGRVVGNVSLIPFFKRGQKIYLVANVATHPEYRRQGIARELTTAAMQRAREKYAQSIWLHVRADNPGAIQLYRELGFVERSRRTSWQAISGTTPPGNEQANIRIVPRPARDWAVQRGWLARAYPETLDWYQPQGWGILKPGIVNGIYRLIADINTIQWSAYRSGTLRGVLACQRTGSRIDRLWAALPEKPEPDAVTMLLLYARRLLAQSYSLAMDYPAGPMDEAIRAAGFSSQRTLVWMEAPGIQPLSA
jgi:GNAT superfamily N-acetyltransferase